MTIILTWDPTILNSANAANLELAYTTAAQFYVDTFSNNITININAAYASLNNNTKIATSGSGQDLYTYSQLKAALGANANSINAQAALASLPATDPTGGLFAVNYAEEKALGLTSTNVTGPNGTETDGGITLNSDIALTVNDPNTPFNSTDRAAAQYNLTGGIIGDFDAIGVIEHEISEIMGRLGNLGAGVQLNGKNLWDPIDLFRYSSAGVRDLTPGPGFFSVNGTTILDPYNDPTKTSNDTVDWADSVNGDSFGQDNNFNTAQLVTPVDIAELNLLGYQTFQQVIDIPLTVSAGQTVSGYVVGGGGDLFVSAGGQAINTTAWGANLTAFVEVQAGAVVSGTILSSGASQYVTGSAANTFIYNGGHELVNNGGTTSNTFVTSGGLIDVNHGTTIGANIDVGAVENISSGGTASSTRVLFGGTLNASSGGAADNTFVYAGGSLNVSSGGYASSTKLSSGGYENVNYATDVAATIFSGGVLDVFGATGLSDSAVVSAGGHLIVRYATASGTIVSSGGVFDFLTDFSSAVGTVVLTGGTMNVDHQSLYDVGFGTASQTTVNGGTENIIHGIDVGAFIINSGSQEVSSGSWASGAILAAAGGQTVLSGANAIGTIVSSGGIQLTLSGGTAAGAIVSNGGLQWSIGAASGTTVSSGGTQDVWGSADGAVLLSGGVQLVEIASIVTNTIFSGGTQNILFAASVVSAAVSNGIQNVSSGGAAVGTQLGSGGYQNIYVGGAVASTSFNGGNQVIFAGAVVDAAVVSAGFQGVSSGGLATNALLVSGGSQFVYYGGATSGTVISNGGIETVVGTASATTISSGGVENVYGPTLA